MWRFVAGSWPPDIELFKIKIVCSVHTGAFFSLQTVKICIKFKVRIFVKYSIGQMAFISMLGY